MDKGKLVAIRDVYGEMLVELGSRHEDIVVLDADLSGSTRTKKFGDRWPKRFFNMGVSEMSMVATAAGLALAGKVPFASTFAIFLAGRALAFVRGRDYALPEDVIDIALDVLRHRMVLSFEALSDDVTSDDVLTSIIDQVPVPVVPLREHGNVVSA